MPARRPSRMLPPGQTQQQARVLRGRFRHRSSIRMYKLYWAPNSGAMAIQALFEEIGVEYEKITIDFEKDENRGE